MLGMEEPMFRFHTFSQTKLAERPLAGTSTDGLVILQLIVNQSPLSLNTIGVMCLIFHQLQGWRGNIDGPVGLLMCIFEVLVVDAHGRSSPFNLSIRNRQKEVENKSGESISSKYHQARHCRLERSIIFDTEQPTESTQKGWKAVKKVPPLLTYFQVF